MEEKHFKWMIIGGVAILLIVIIVRYIVPAIQEMSALAKSAPLIVLGVVAFIIWAFSGRA